MEKEIELESKLGTEKSTIKHIVCAGGGVTGFSYYGILRECHKKELWKLEDIESMYGTSVGSILIILLTFNYDWETLDNFLIKRPWNNVFNFNIYSIFESFNKKGIFNIKSIRETFLPIFNGKDISIDITMQELYELTKIDIHIFTTEMNKFETIDISYKTHPNWKVIDAVYCSCALPVVFTPYLIENKCYCDGGFLMNYPLIKCIENGATPDEIIALNRKSRKQDKPNMDSESSLLDFIIMILNKLIKNISKYDKIEIKNEFIVERPSVSLYDIYNATTSIEERINLIQLGAGLVTNNSNDIDDIKDVNDVNDMHNVNDVNHINST
jgi:predicted acylesterase/phospholipase RssA